MCKPLKKEVDLSLGCFFPDGIDLDCLTRIYDRDWECYPQPFPVPTKEQMPAEAKKKLGVRGSLEEGAPALPEEKRNSVHGGSLRCDKTSIRMA